MPQLCLGNGHLLLFDECDQHLVDKYKWFAAKGCHTYYARGRYEGRQDSFHRAVLGREPEVIDHINGNGLDNRRCNLRACTSTQNMQNRRKVADSTSRFKGVYRDKGRWRAQIKQNGARMDLGHFDSEEQAARQYDRAARLFHGSFARTNEMLGLYA